MSRIDPQPERWSKIRVDRRGVCSPIASILFVGLLVVLAGTVMSATFCVESALTGPPPSVSLSASASGDRIELVHRGGDQIDVQQLTVFVRINGNPLTEQPPVPFFAAEGFRSGPTGPFNSASPHDWSPGERASFRIATTNNPYPSDGDRIKIRLSVRGRPVTTVTAHVE